MLSVFLSFVYSRIVFSSFGLVGMLPAFIFMRQIKTVKALASETLPKLLGFLTLTITKTIAKYSGAYVGQNPHSTV